MQEIYRIARFEKVSFKQFFEDYITISKEALEKGQVSLPTLNAGELMTIWENIRIPTRATKDSAGYDFKSPISFDLSTRSTIKIPTGIRCQIHQGWFLQIAPRSGVGTKYRLQLDNTLGIIDGDYYNANNEGHIMLQVTNDGHTNKNLSVQQGQGLAQGAFLLYGITFDDEVQTMRTGGFGSTGK